VKKCQNQEKNLNQKYWFEKEKLLPWKELTKKKGNKMGKDLL